MQNKKKNSKPYVAAFLAMGAAVVLYSLIFKLYRWQHYLIAAAVALLVGRIVFIMAQGVDTSKKAPTQQPIPKTGDSTPIALYVLCAALAVACAAWMAKRRKA